MLIFPTTNETYSLVSCATVNRYSWVSVKQLFMGFCETAIRGFL